MPDSDSGSRRISTPTPVNDLSTGRPDVAHADTAHTEKVRVDTVKVEHAPAPPARPAPAASTAPTRDPLPEVRPARAAKTSAAAVFALVFGLAALFCALTAILSPAAVLFGIIGLVLAFVGMKMAKKPGVTGRGVAIGGLVTALLGLILGGVVLGGLASVVNNKTQLDRIQGFLDKQQAKLPSTGEVRDKVDNTVGQ